jgi:hypothetical protein
MLNDVAWRRPNEAHKTDLGGAGGLAGYGVA